MAPYIEIRILGYIPTRVEFIRVTELGLQIPTHCQAIARNIIETLPQRIDQAIVLFPAVLITWIPPATLIRNTI